MEQQIEVTTTLPVLQTNFETVSKALDQELARYEGLVVTVDNIKEAKKDATAINKLAGEIDKRRKEAVSEVSEPIKIFESQMKDLRERCKSVRQGIVDQVAVFEDKVRDQARALLFQAQHELWGANGVREDYQRSQFDDLITLSAVTGKGNLSKSARQALELRVSQDKAAQDRVDRRLLELERDSYAAGLAAPLTINHVRHIIESEDDEYRAGLDSIMAAELKREEMAEIRRRQAAEREAAMAAQTEQANQKEAAEAKEQAEAAESAKRAAQQTPTPEQIDGQQVWRVTAVFEISTPAVKNISPDQLKQHVTKRLTDAGIPEPAYMEAVQNVGA